MRRLLMAAAACAALSACTLNERFVKAVKTSYAPIRDDYKRLLDEKGKQWADTGGQSGYDPDTVRIRKANADELWGLVEDASKEK